MKDFIKILLLKALKIQFSIHDLNHFYVWQNLNNFRQPFPQFVKEKVFNKYNLKNSIWIETGTYLGESTKYLSKISNKVYSLEPDKELFDKASKNLENFPNIELLNKTSENGLEEILINIKKENLCFWLDGHYSGGTTHKGKVDTPILEELKIIRKYLSKNEQINILIDDFRLFEKNKNNKEEYPDKSLLIKWAEDNDMNWTIESDIMIIQHTNKM